MKLAKYLLLFLCFVPLLLFRDFTPNNELKYLSIADEALRDGHFFAFWNHGAPYADKPPLYLWIVMLGKWLFGTHNMFFLGLFSLIPAFITIHIMDKWVTPFLNGRYRNSIILMMITSGLFVGSAIVLRMDMLMCMFIVLALYTFYKCYTGKENKYDPIRLPIYIFLAIFQRASRHSSTYHQYSCISVVARKNSDIRTLFRLETMGNSFRIMLYMVWLCIH